ncbi:cyclin-dependent kinase inhibitor 5-like isoform X2 [Asparagus officinalis]|uniref:cyclin-dependent kinase inhibitor 5-like isoform X2 n=1 Tax=Asparagus officinalis TaxID=4686 RepID=UPI00098E6E61|nr:cyclin-dependent kinase inhibitor 5-like isoform X2 [Asparagus officinalis]
MGKYIQKGKIKGELSVMEVSHHNQSPSSLGVRTRAKTKTLALQRLQNAAPKPKSSPCSSASSSSSSKSPSCYLQLRSRRLEKCFASKTQKGSNPRNANPSPSKRSEGSKRVEAELEKDLGKEVSFGDNVLDVEGNGSRNSRETTPCSPIRRDSESLGTPGSTNRPTTSTTVANAGIESSTRRNIPTSREMEEFFAVPEQRQQRAFAEKYIFLDHPPLSVTLV